MVLGCVVHAASVQDRDGAKWVLARATFDFARLRIVRADAGYASRLERWVRTSCLWSLEIIRRTSQGLVILPKRWVIERTFDRLGKYRRFSNDYEILEASSEEFIYVVIIHIMVRRLN